MNKFIIRTIVMAFVSFYFPKIAHAQNGDQILDGIGETDMIARYIFNGDLKDWSRNNLHSNILKTVPKFENDEQFGKVLSLSGGTNEFITLPKGIFTDFESISLTGWFYLRSKMEGQTFFRIGKDADSQLFVSPGGKEDQSGYQAVLRLNNRSIKSTAVRRIETGKWVHISVVMDLSSRSLILYLDGKQVDKLAGIPQEIGAMLRGQTSGVIESQIGKSILPGQPNIKALLHDFRIYRVALTSNQIAGIYKNSLRGVREDIDNMGKKEDDLPSYPMTKAQLYNAFLMNVADVEVETSVGELPHLPNYLQGTYKDGMEGPKVRVLWPSPMDNTAVIEKGRYSITGRIPGTDFRPKATVTIKGEQKETPKLTLSTFELNDVSLNVNNEHQETKFIENREKFVQALAKTDPNSFLYMFRHAYGQEQPAEAKPLGVWDSKDTKLRGHATGHYLTAIAQAYAGSGYDKNLQENFSAKMTYMVDELYRLSQLSGRPKTNGGNSVSDPRLVPVGPGKSKYDSDLSDEGIRTDYWNWGEGFISAYPPDQFIMLEKGAKYGGQKDQVWGPYYTLHKIMAGLLDIYEVSKNRKALIVASGMGDWVFARLSVLPKDRLITMWNTYIAGELGGMNEVMARLYRLTDQEKYFKAAQLFDNIDLFYGDAEHTHGLAKNVDTFRGLHANQHIPQIIGSIEMYRASDQSAYYKIAENFWYKTVNDYMYSIGGVAGARNPANAECFISQPATLYENGFSAGGQNETCATYNMLKLTADLFLFDQRGEFMDYYERGLYNHILASVAKDSPANTYHISLRPGSLKQFSNADMTGFTCCNGTALESSTKLQNSIYFKSGDNSALYVNLFVPSTLYWKEKNVTIEQRTDFPKADVTRLIMKGSGTFDLNIRVPGWATKGFFVTINGRNESIQATPGTYLKISRAWNDGDTIELKMPFQFHLDPVMDQPNIASLFYGPILLAAQEPEARKQWRKITLEAKDIGSKIKGNPSTLEFKIDDAVFKPFYETYGRHSVYLDVTLK
ncbi:beta-L-arabinofuranosidase domain-containing protein [Sphingobacterium sp. R2]|uniref:beta-L-arabinofuranosidase domain-containing protein n=1 Tax=Sphingobacterium sp. R2 TaxID=3112958 RepID=UPI00345D77D4